MKHSPEIESLMRASVAALERSDLAFIEEHTSRADGTVAIGSDPAEYARDFDTIMRLMADSTADAGPQIRVTLDEIHGYEEGDIGWSDATGHFEHDGATVPVRITDVARREDGVWRSVQTHASIGVPTASMFDSMFTGAGAAT
ncbi:MAG TPA: nuclear transport factor 2 family protein [Gaiellales bacterium]|nr:nuclear transport factor 2 family protein [Gaiellales bacterium]